ncbi:Clavaminate synthase-like protein [Trichoderma citrinoviride]|uniref:Clavaminate synthase-like protein n=1 Tax=Trichoderma citrinoviride TaxID=58853 RepID=A0A2T4B8H1_9HYPO|nr:Clavaminate synthase-like protein [Trichoderma citrinoviride]PTB65521.1 Clavaminate synthase-like protein [Trichoderma citrinoviride]
MPSAVELESPAVDVPTSQPKLKSTSPPPLPVTVPSVSLTAGVDAAALETASKVLHIIDRYRLKRPIDAEVKRDEGALKFLALIYTHVKAGEAVPMCLPAFPFKSPNSQSKVLGKLPDRAEELALAHLHGLCLAIQDIYPPGANLTIISDGLVYNDLLGVPDRDVWHYGETLRAIARARGYKHIFFSRLRDLVAIQLPEQLDEMTYVANASNFRRALLNTFSRPDWDWKTVSQTEDVCLTYRGYIKFLETDLQTVYPVGDDRSKTKYKRGIEYIAQQMMARGDAFASAVRQKYKDSVRLSIHPSNMTNKLSISLLPTDAIYTTPWHCAVAYRLDGTTSTVILRGFVKKPNKDQFAKKAEEFGKLTSWKFGLILEVKDRGTNTQGLNNVLSMEPMPFHYDGLFKTVKQVDDNGKESLVSTPPRFQIFVGATSSPRDTGYTLFSSSTLFLKHLPDWLQLEALSEMTWTVSTASFDQTVLKGLPLITPHPVTGKPCLRYHEPWPQHKTKFEPTKVTIDGLDAADSAAICEAIDSVLYDRRVVYYHVWDKGDIVVSDNILMMHTRSAFLSGSDRELWRIHFD